MLIGLVGKKGSGKDTLADFIVKEYSFVKYAYATPLKEACKILFLLSDDQLHDRELKETIDNRWDMTPRKMMQTMGTDLIRTHIDPNFWIKHFSLWFKNNSEKNVIVTDCRFQNEIDIVIKLGGKIIKINRETEFDEHESEVGIDKLQNIDFIINNNSTKSNLFDQVKYYINLKS